MASVTTFQQLLDNPAISIYEDWLANKYGSRQLANLAHSENEELEYQDCCSWELQFCETAGIPCHTYIAKALNCARERLKTNENERDTVCIYNHRLENEAISHYKAALMGYILGPYSYLGDQVFSRSFV